MLKKNLMIGTLYLLLFPFSANAEEGVFSIDNFSANIGLGTDYIFRGETQNDNDPAISGGIDWEYENYYLGVWASMVDFTSVVPDSDVELDVYGGYQRSLGPFDFDLGLFYYMYPGADDDAAELDYFEVIPSLSYGFDTTFEPTVYVHYGYSPDFFGEEGTQHNFESGMSLSLPHGFGLDGWVGYTEADGDVNGTEIEWTYWSVGVTNSVYGFDLDLRYHGADEDSRVLWLANDDAAEDIVTFSISRSF